METKSFVKFHEFLKQLNSLGVYMSRTLLKNHLNQYIARKGKILYIPVEIKDLYKKILS